MKPEHRMLLWEQWRQTRAYLILPFFVALIHAGMAIMVRLSEMKESDVIFLTDAYVLGALLVAALVFCLHFDRRMSLRLGVPERTFRLPVSSSTLILCQLGYRMAVVLLIFLASLLLHRVANGPATLLQVPGTLAFLTGFYAIALAVTSLIQPFSFGAKAKFLTPFFLFALAVAVPAWSAAAYAPPLYGLITVGLGFGGAIWAHGRARHGGLEFRNVTGFSRGEVKYVSASEIPSFSSPLEAQRWLEGRRFGWMIPAAGVLIALSMVVYAVVWGGSGMYWAPWLTPYESPPWVLSVLFPAALVGLVLVYFDYKMPETPLGRYVFTRPVSARLMASARWRMAAWSLSSTLFLVTVVIILAWLFRVDRVHQLHPYSEMNEFFPTAVRLGLDWIIFASIAFGLVFLVSRTLVLSLGIWAVLFVIYGVLDSIFIEARFSDDILLAEVAVLLGLVGVTVTAWRQGVHRLHIVWRTLGGMVLWFMILLLRDLAQQEEWMGYWNAQRAFRGVEPYPLMTGAWVLVALCSVPLAFHRRRSQSLWGRPLQGPTQEVRRDAKRALQVALGVLLVAGLVGLYHWRLRSVGEIHIEELRRHAVYGMAREQGVDMPEQENIWTLNVADWEALYGGQTGSYLDLGRLTHLVSARQSPGVLPEPGDPLTPDLVEAIGQSLEDWESLGPQSMALAMFSESAWALLRREQLPFAALSAPQSLAAYNVIVQLGSMRIWRLADEGRAEEAWEQFERFFRNVNEVYGQERVLEAADVYAGQEAPARLFMHLLRTCPAPEGLWRRLLQSLPGNYDIKAASAPAVAAYIKSASYLERNVALWRYSRRPDGTLVGGADSLREQWLNYGIYGLSGQLLIDRYNYLSLYYNSLLRPSQTADVFRYQRNLRIDSNSPVLGLLQQDAITQYTRSMSLQLRQQLFRCAVAVLAYREDYGFIPERLSQLVPGYLDSLPADLFMGDSWDESHAEASYFQNETKVQRPIWSFHYRILDADSAIVYSVGSNRRDDFDRIEGGRSQSDDIAIRIGPLATPATNDEGILHP